MPAPSSKSMLVLAVLAVVLSASLLLVSIPGYDGEDDAGAAEDQTTTDWSEVKAVVFNNKVPTGYKTIQAAIDSIVGEGTVYVAKHQSQENGETITISSEITINGDQAITLRPITIKNGETPSIPVDTVNGPTITRAEGYQGSLFHILSDGETSDSSPLLTIVGMTICGNDQKITATDPLIIIAEGSVKISQSKLCCNNNTSGTSLGGAVRCEEGAEVELISSEITGCHSTKGGAVYSSGGLIVSDTSIHCNTSAGDGSAIYSDGLREVYVNSQSEIYSNSSDDGSGQITIVGSELTVVNSTVRSEDEPQDEPQDEPDCIIELVASDVSDLMVRCNNSEVYGSISMTVDGTCLAAWLVDMFNSKGKVTLRPSGDCLGLCLLSNTDAGESDPNGLKVESVLPSGYRLESQTDDSSINLYYLSNSPDPDDDGVHTVILSDKDGNPRVGTYVSISKDGKILFAGFTDSEGRLGYSGNLGLCMVRFSTEYSADNMLSVPLTGSDQTLEGEGLNVILGGDYPIYVREVDVEPNSILFIETKELSDNETIAEFSPDLGPRQNLVKYVDISFGEESQKPPAHMVFSLELPDGIDPDRVILFREHDGFVTEMGYVPSSSFWNSTDDCFTVEYIGGSYYVTVRSSQFSVFAVGEEEPAPSPPPERTVVTAVIEDRQVRISVGPESYKEHSVRDSEGNLLLGWQSGASGLTIRFDLLPPGAEYRVMGRYAGTTSEILEATIVAPKDPVIEVVSVGVDSVILSSEEMVEYRLLLEDGTPVGGWVPGDGEDKVWADLDPTLDYYAEATSTSDGMTLSTGPVLVKAGVSAEVTGVMKHGGAFLVVTGIGQGLSCTADAAVYHSSGMSVTFGPIQTGTVTLTFTGSDGGEVRTMEVLVPLVPQDSGDDADVITIDSQEGVMYRLHDHTGAVVSDGWVHGGGELSWSVDPSKGYFVTMVTGNEDGAVLFPMTEVKRPAEMLASGEAA